MNRPLRRSAVKWWRRTAVVPWRRTAAVLWSGFLVAAALELAVFAFVDPETLHGLQGGPLQLSSTAVYSVAFFVFWVAAAAGAALCLLLDGGADQINATAGRSPLSNGFSKRRR